ncbi:type I-E CRISPR-associated protein Cas6/Cse3/CasE [Streptomyces sp. Ru87]|uniref:type I-E CRISPR-associated protein Cas6/Cse3/CasE n=1 Tax=Streptomyces sp. Ru87 TaxID=2044307 RepID=UPI000BF445A4|nr:type I-E CRISPR-associated protein Cas6/Cse3/CasE [Streptomyces sp. Ru87]PGH46926.1 type I-E CRISPR-associated protein Cas6/Cse3/CasE [Streptomyces sp. Ru87]
MSTKPLWVTEIRPDTRSSRDARRDINSAVGLHHRVMSLFPDGLGQDARQTAGVLFRLDEGPSGHVILVQSAVKPDVGRLDGTYGMARCKELTPLLEGLKTGTRVHYRITANATRKLGKNTTAGRPKQIVPLHGEEAEEWWVRQAERAGLGLRTIVSAPLSDAAGVRSDKNKVVHARTRFDGQAVVQEVAALVEQLAAGFGRGKSYGCGLLSIAPAR